MLLVLLVATVVIMLVFIYRILKASEYLEKNEAVRPVIISLASVIMSCLLLSAMSLASMLRLDFRWVAGSFLFLATLGAVCFIRHSDNNS
jgi:uncharacterized membrane protein